MKECKCTLAQKTVGDGCSICNPQLMIEMLQEQIQELEATIEAQEIIIKDMSQPKTCDDCKYYDGDFTIHPCINCMYQPCMISYYEPKVQP